MPRADTAMRIQRTPALKYMGASLVGERQLLTPRFPSEDSPFLPAELGEKAVPGCPQPGTCFVVPALYPCSHYASETGLSHAGTPEHPRVLSFPKAHYTPKYNPSGVTRYSPECCCTCVCVPVCVSV